ncbi:hypothetical protein cypCar_00012176, partial [Cyprinus carpio]
MNAALNPAFMGPSAKTSSMATNVTVDQVGQAFTVKMTLMSACCNHATRECASRMSLAMATPASVGLDL